MTTQRPPPPAAPAATPTPSAADHPMDPAPEEPEDVHMAPAESDEQTFTDMLKSNEAAMAPIPDVIPDLVEISTSPRRYAPLDLPVRHATSTHLRPTIHPPTRPDPDVPMTPVVPQQPCLYQLFAEVFRPLPFIGNLFKLVPDAGYELSHASIICLRVSISFGGSFPLPPLALTLHILSQRQCPLT